jgi:carbamoyltransferase
LGVDDIGRKENTGERFDKAAATQMVFEDVLFHVIGRLIRRTGSRQLVLTGGTALNGVANMRLLEHFAEGFYEQYLGRKNTRLHIWVPPVPGDAGVTLGAAYQFAIRAGADWGSALDNAFYCGPAASAREIRDALDGCADIGWIHLGDVGDLGSLDAIADLLAHITSMDGVAALYQGRAETGPRALGHRSILANPCNPQTRDVLNRLVKYREAIRPLAPMATLAAARRWFDLSPGAADSEYNAYYYMVLTARARPESYRSIPAVIHRDGTVRVQIVRRQQNPFTHAYLKALGRRIGVEVAVNTSFNVAGPIVQTARQALDTLKRSKGIDAVFFLSSDGPAYAAWHDVVSPPKDGGHRLRQWVEDWRAQTGA